MAKASGLAIDLLETRDDAFKLVPQGRARYCAVDPHRLVPSGALQISGDTGNPVPAGGSQTAAEQAFMDVHG